MVHIISTELEIPLTAVTVQSSVSGSPIVTFPSVSFPSVSLSKRVICTKGTGTKMNVYTYNSLMNKRRIIATRIGRNTSHYIC